MTDPNLHPAYQPTPTTIPQQSQPVYIAPTSASTLPTKSHTNINIIFVILVLCYEALALPIYGVLFRLSSLF